MVSVSDLIIAHPEMRSFRELERLVVEAARQGEIFLHFDVKPDYPDTPRAWDLQLEAAFYRGRDVEAGER